MTIRRAVALLAAPPLVLSGMVALAPAAPAASAPAALAPAAAEAALRAAAGGGVTLSRGPDGVVRLIGTAAGHAVPQPAGVARSAAPQTLARAHLARYGSLFGIRDEAHQLRLTRVLHATGGPTVVRFQQMASDLPVLAGELNVSLAADGSMLSLNGETAHVVSQTAYVTTPAQATGIAIASTARANHVAAGRQTASTPQRWLYDGSLVGPTRVTGARSVWRVEVWAAGVRQLVLVDGASGAVALSFNQVATAKERHVCDLAGGVQAGGDNRCLRGYVRSEGDPAVAVRDVNDAYDFSGATYDFFFNRFGRDSVDDAGKPLVSAVRFCPAPTACPYHNAYWDGSQMTYGDGYASADDVVAHELTHGVTQFTNDLLYYYQSGAINESMSDVFGELVDLTDGVGTDTTAVRWQLGEDLAGGAIRDMKDPTPYGNPDKMTSLLWDSDWSDAGGVHTNSGVNNKAAYLMTDGAVFNGHTVTGIGIPKAAAVYYGAEQLLTSGSDYKDLYGVLQQSCTSLVGGLEGITAADCVQVKNALDAVQMNAAPVTDAPVPAAPSRCTAGSTQLTDNFNTDLAQWTPSGPWSLNTFYQNTPTSGSALYVPDVSAGVDYKITTSAAFTVPVGRPTYFRFDHAESFDWESTPFPNSYFDGGVVEISTNNGVSWAALNVAANGYPHVLEPPLSRPAFSGDSSDWYTSQATLTAYAGRSVKLRFRMLTDGFAAGSTAYGWWIDNVSLYSCPSRQVGDFTGDGRADLGVWRPSNATFYLKGVSTTPIAGGARTDVPVPADYNGDGRSEPATWRPSTGVWTIPGRAPVAFGQSGDVAVPADYNGDGTADLAIRRGGTWFVRGLPGTAYGSSTDRSVPADYNGDGTADLAVWRPSNGTWYVRGVSTTQFGQAGDVPVQADYTGDGRADIAIRRGATWYVRDHGSLAYGYSTDRPVAADYRADGKADIAVWRPVNGTWYVRGIPSAQWGVNGDTPLH